MESNKKNLLIAIAVIFTLLSFTSCENEDYSKRGALDVPRTSTLYADKYGSFNYYFDIYVVDIQNVNVYREDLISATLNTSEFWITGDYIGRTALLALTPETDRGGRYVSDIPIDNTSTSNVGLAYINERDNGYAMFMEDLANRVITYGSVRLYVKGTFLDRKNVGIPNVTFDLEIRNNLDLRIRG